MLTEEDYQEKINSYSYEDWKPLLKLIPQIEKTSKFGEMAGGGIDSNGVLQMPYWKQSPVVSKFTEITYNIPIIIDFDWGSWKVGRKIANDKKFDFDTIDVPTKCKIITAIIRNDRFCDGALVEAFELGIILKILKSIQKQVEEN